MPAREVALVWDPKFLEYDFGSGHPFSEVSRGLAVRLLESIDARSGRPARWIREVSPATNDALGRFHRRPYLDRVAELDRHGARELLDRGDTPSFPGCYRASARLVAGALATLEELDQGRASRAFHPAGGLHHAHPDAASGFCIFNDLAVTIATALDGAAHRRVAYLDLDVHHGDGVMYGFYRDGRVLDIDFHQDGRTIFPGTGEVREVGAGDGAGLKVNLPLPPGAGDETFLPLFHRVVPPLLREFRPELLVVQHGVDAHVDDRLGGLCYTPNAYAQALSTILGLCEELSIGKLLVTGGGGYSPENVARVLALAGLRLLDAPVPAERAGDALPEGWRAQFAAAVGRAAPTSWGPVERTPPSSTPPGEVDVLVRDLERHLGRRFPPETG